VAEETVKARFTVFGASAATIKDNSSDLSYLFRYTIVDKEGARLSEWSSINQAEQENVSNVLGSFTPTYSVSSIESGGRGIKVQWTVPDSFVAKELDVYFSWSYNSNASTFTPFQYADSVTSNSYYVDIPFESSIKAKFVKVAVQLPTSVKVVNTNALLFESEIEDTRPLLDGGDISML
jgi:hypothetical protein